MLTLVQELERLGGRARERELRFGPRPLDIDILLYGSLVLHAADLYVPHPRMHRRPFVLEPLLEIAPHWNDPRTGVPWRLYLP